MPVAELALPPFPCRLPFPQPLGQRGAGVSLLEGRSAMVSKPQENTHGAQGKAFPSTDTRGVTRFIHTTWPDSSHGSHSPKEQN